MYKAYEAKNDSPYMRTFMYLSLVKFFFAIVALLYLEAFLDWMYPLRFTNTIESSYFIVGLMAVILASTYFFYTRRNIDYFEERFDRHVSLNRTIKVWMLIAFPFLVFIGGFFLCVLLFGGEIFGEPILGVLN